MSTDLQLLHDLPEPRVSSTASAVKIELPDLDHTDRVDSSAEAAAAHSGREEDESCRTPTSKENRIPEALTCPPAPKKAKRAVSCKRKLLEEFQLFEKVNKDEIDGFFRSNFPKRSCRCT
ncbi:cyclin-dependent protein kinase inhibitor SMR2-like [Neltuma alba]|uniref:cyclin-dependent protein kinase inhibitor SMR2-like n=1 Tax=Neltuma alba TaxID=207710 RepID=UPI0010A35193|nr:cyclin-dependent protein kinase inhibitor SMR2-like [Prosopis alba]XP_028793238.1 cyclin-dependent protein kinase inhibitor SMR2-like [Prosopis alba]